MLTAQDQGQVLAVENSNQTTSSVKPKTQPEYYLLKSAIATTAIGPFPLRELAAGYATATNWERFIVDSSLDFGVTTESPDPAIVYYAVPYEHPNADQYRNKLMLKNEMYSRESLKPKPILTEQLKIARFSQTKAKIKKPVEHIGQWLAKVQPISGYEYVVVVDPSGFKWRRSLRLDETEKEAIASVQQLLTFGGTGDTASVSSPEKAASEGESVFVEDSENLVIIENQENIGNQQNIENQVREAIIALKENFLNGTPVCRIAEKITPDAAARLEETLQHLHETGEVLVVIKEDDSYSGVKYLELESLQQVETPSNCDDWETLLDCTRKTICVFEALCPRYPHLIPVKAVREKLQQWEVSQQDKALTYLGETGEIELICKGNTIQSIKQEASLKPTAKPVEEQAIISDISENAAVASCPEKTASDSEKVFVESLGNIGNQGSLETQQNQQNQVPIANEESQQIANPLETVETVEIEQIKEYAAQQGLPPLSSEQLQVIAKVRRDALAEMDKETNNQSEVIIPSTTTDTYIDPNVPPDPENYETQELYDQAFEQWTIVLAEANKEDERKQKLLLQFQVGQRVTVKNTHFPIEGQIVQILGDSLSAAVRVEDENKTLVEVPVEFLQAVDKAEEEGSGGEESGGEGSGFQPSPLHPTPQHPCSLHQGEGSGGEVLGFTANSQKKRTPNKSARFDYQQNFANEALATSAKQIKGEAIAFFRRTFTDLINLGSHLWNFMEDCLRELGSTGKKAFEKWLIEDFGGSRYLADAAMKLSPWYGNLDKKTQKLIRLNVDKWSVAALKQLPKLTADLVKDLVNQGQGKQTANSIKEFVANHNSIKPEEANKLLAKYATQQRESLSGEDAQKVRSRAWELTEGEVLTFGAIVQALEDLGYQKKIAKTWSVQGIITQPATAEDWQIAFECFEITGNNCQQLQEQALLLAKDEAAEGTEPVVTVGHIDRLLLEYDYRKKKEPEERVPGFLELREMMVTVGILKEEASKNHQNRMVLERPDGYSCLPFPIVFIDEEQAWKWWQQKGEEFGRTQPLPVEVQNQIRESYRPESGDAAEIEQVARRLRLVKPDNNSLQHGFAITPRQHLTNLWQQLQTLEHDFMQACEGEDEETKKQLNAQCNEVSGQFREAYQSIGLMEQEAVALAKNQLLESVADTPAIAVDDVNPQSDNTIDRQELAQLKQQLELALKEKEDIASQVQQLQKALEEKEQLLAQVTHLKSELKTKENRALKVFEENQRLSAAIANLQSNTTEQPQPGDVVRITRSDSMAITGRLGIFKKIEVDKSSGIGERVQAIVITDVGMSREGRIEIDNWENSLAKVNLTPEELAEINQNKEAIARQKDMTEQIEYSQQVIEENQEIKSDLEEVGFHLSSLGFNGWSWKGYCDRTGEIHKGIDGFKAFVKELFEAQETELAF